MKAIGSSNVKTMLQFICEAVTLTLLGMVAGVVIGAAAANPVTKTLVNNSSSNTTQAQVQGPPTGTRGLRAFGGNSVTNIKNIQASVGLNVLGYGAATALVIAVLGSAIPALLISKIRPADVMRAE
jgi:ABC-type antimicrobial peptide transport system permease subunit